MPPHRTHPQQHSSCLPVQAYQTPAARRQVVASAHKKKPGRVAGKQAGSTYYQNYLRNRRERGGEFLGPPLLLADIQQQQLQQQQQQQQDAEAGLEAQQQTNWQVSASSPTSQETGSQLLEQQQQEQQQQQQEQQLVLSASHVADAAIDPASIQALLEACLAAAASPLAAQANTNVQPDQQQASAGQQQQQRQVRSRLELQRQATKQRQRQPAQLYDYVPPGMADSMVSMLKRKGGLAVWPPDIPTQVEPLIQLPRLPAAHTSSSTGNSTRGSTNPSSSSDSSTDPASVPARRRVLHVFWDVSSLHPGGYDPRVLVAQLRRVLRCYGDVVGVYAYGIQKLFNWIPESFMLQYAPDRLPGRRRNQQDGQVSTIRSQQPDVQRLLQQAAQAGVKLEESLGPLRCRVCGNLRDNYRQLHSHMVQRHKQAAPPLEKLLPAGALADMVNAAIAAASGSSGSYGGTSGSKGRNGGSTSSNGGSHGSSSSQVGRQQSADARAAAGPLSASAAAGTGQRSQFTWRVADPWAMRNSSTRTLGRVSRYYNSRGDQFIPPNGHQISLKYVLVREGVEVRTVQRKARAVSAAVADALHATLHGELLTRTAAEVQETQDVLVVVSDQGTHAAVVLEARRKGVPVIAVCGKKKRCKEADITLRWQWVASGRYDTG